MRLKRICAGCFVLCMVFLCISCSPQGPENDFTAKPVPLCGQSSVMPKISSQSLTLRNDPPELTEGKISAHQQMWIDHLDYTHTTSTRKSRSLPMAKGVTAAAKTLKKNVFGFYPHWMGTSYAGLDWNLLSTVAYFGAELDAAGAIANSGGWPSSTTAVNVVDYAHQNNTRVELTVIAFSGAIHNGILKNETNRANCITAIVAAAKQGNADGINIDFEGMSGSCKTYFTAFITELHAKIDEEMTGGSLSIDVPAVDWTGVFEIAALSPYVDAFFIMGYDYHWSTGSPGPVSPLAGTTYNLTRSAKYYLSRAVTPAKVIVGVPLYGYDWPVAVDESGNKTYETAKAVLYSSTVSYTYTWDDATSTPWYNYDVDCNFHEVWFENPSSIDKKLQMIIAQNAGGLGLWALGYDGGNEDLWGVIEQYMVDDSAQ